MCDPYGMVARAMSVLPNQDIIPWGATSVDIATGGRLGKRQTVGAEVTIQTKPDVALSLLARALQKKERIG